jgi:hypothetical protein
MQATPSQTASQSLGLRPPPPPERVESRPDPWTWGLSVLALLFFMVIWMHFRKRPIPVLSPAEQLDQAVDGSLDLTIDLSQRYARLHQAIRSFLAQEVDQRWSSYDGGQARMAWGQLLADRPEAADAWARAWEDAERIAFGPEEATEAQLAALLALAQGLPETVESSQHKSLNSKE